MRAALAFHSLYRRIRRIVHMRSTIYRATTTILLNRFVLCFFDRKPRRADESSFHAIRAEKSKSQLNIIRIQNEAANRTFGIMNYLRLCLQKQKWISTYSFKIATLTCSKTIMYNESVGRRAKMIPIIMIPIIDMKFQEENTQLKRRLSQINNLSSIGKLSNCIICNNDNLFLEIHP